MINIAILGFGNIGRGSFELLNKSANIIAKSHGIDIVVKYILVKTLPQSNNGLFINDFSKILNDKSITIVIHAIGGTTDSYEYIKQCLEAGKSIVTANKDVVATYALELAMLAEKHNVKFLFEAAACGGIPIIKTLKDRQRFVETKSFFGILNGTSNYILSSMNNKGVSFEEALKDAQKLGYAEQDPSNDVSGLDSAYKTAILGSIAFGSIFTINDLFYRGLDYVDNEDNVFAKKMNYKIKILGFGIRNTNNESVSLGVLPFFISKDSPFYLVNGSLNGILINGDDSLGSLFLSGPGAGSSQTAPSIVNDILDVISNSSQNHFGRVNCAITADKSIPNIKLLIKSSKGYNETSFNDCDIHDASLKVFGLI